MYREAVRQVAVGPPDAVATVGRLYRRPEGFGGSGGGDPVSRGTGDGERDWRYTNSLVLLYGFLLAVLAALLVAVFGDASGGEPFAFAAVVIGLTAGVMLLIALANGSCAGEALAVLVGLAAVLIAVLAALQSLDDMTINPYGGGP
jgi:hypothetical protein